MAWGLALYTVGAACVPMVGSVGAMAVLLLVTQQIFGDAGHTLHDVHDRTLRQTAVPADLPARADAGIRSAGQLCTLARALAGRVLGDALGARSVLWLAVLAGGAAAVPACWGEGWKRSLAPDAGGIPGRCRGEVHPAGDAEPIPQTLARALLARCARVSASAPNGR
jgi:hypothetical protein